MAVATPGAPPDARAWTTPVDTATHSVSLLTGSGVDIGRSVAVGPDGSLYVAGLYNSPTLSVTSSAQVVHTVSNAGGNDAFLARFDAQGEPVWLRSFGGTGDDVAYAVAVDGAGRVVVVGGFSATATFSAASPVVVRTSSGPPDGYVASVDSAGVLQWVTVVGGTDNDIVNGVAVGPGDVIAVTASVVGDVSVGALTSPATVGDTSNFDGLVAAFDASGAAMWSVRVAGTGSDAMERVAVGTDGSVVATGAVQGSVSVVATDLTAAVTPDPGGFDAIATKLDRDGNLATGWARRFGGAGGDAAYSVGIDASGRVSVASTVDGDVTVGSQTVPGGAGSDILVTQYDPSGTLRWANRMPDNGSADQPRGLAIGPEGQVVTVGRLGASGQSHMAVMAHDTAGRLIWGPTLVGVLANQIGLGVAVDAAGSVYLTGRFAGGRIDQNDAASSVAVGGASDAPLIKFAGVVPPAPAVVLPPLIQTTTTTTTTTVPPSTTVPVTPVPVPQVQVQMDGVVLDASGVSLVRPGTTWTLDLTGLAPDSGVRVELYSSPRLLWEGRADAAGAVRADITVPPDVEAGRHTLVIVGTGVGGAFRSEFPVVVTALDDRLPATGSSPAWPVATALVVLGLLAVATGRRRPRW